MHRLRDQVLDEAPQAARVEVAEVIGEVDGYLNVDADFLPVQWLVRIGDVRASMTMGQPFPDIWLPRGLEVSAAFTLAVGAFDLRYALTYHDYKLADVASKVTVPSQGR